MVIRANDLAQSADFYCKVHGLRVSDRIRVVSIIGRFLEHSRLFYFANGGAEEYYIGSADWMPRNFDRRVEAVVPVEDPALHRRLRALLTVLAVIPVLLILIRVVAAG